MRRLKLPVYLAGSEEKEETHKVLSAGVCRSDALLLLQTRDVLAQPDVLLEVCTSHATRHTS